MKLIKPLKLKIKLIIYLLVEKIYIYWYDLDLL